MDTLSEEKRLIIMLSMLEHYVYCPRQCALIHLDQTFEENIFTQRGQRIHKNIDVPSREQNSDIRVESALPLWSRRLGLVGKADVVEFHGDIPYPVDYKHGPKAKINSFDVQLCGQALCLEEMMDIPVPRGAIFHYKSRRRREVEFDDNLRSLVKTTVDDVRLLLSKSILPDPVDDARCRHCSLKDLCMPSITGWKNKINIETISRLLYENEGD